MSVQSRQIAYDIFHTLMRNRDLVPGQLVTQKELLAMMGVTQNPLRGALARLEVEGFLTILPQHGIKLIEPSLKAFKNVTQIRIAIEKEAWNHFAFSAPEGRLGKWIEEHEAFLEECQSRITPELLVRFSEYDQGMHHIVINAMENERIADLFRVALVTTLFMRPDRGYVRAYTIKNTIQEHIEVLRAAEKQDIPSLLPAIERHLMGAVQRFVV